MKENILNLLKIWSNWGIFDEKFLFGLEATFLRKKIITIDDLTHENELNIDIKIYLNKILEEINKNLNSSNDNYLENQCKIMGLSYRDGNQSEIISRIFTFEEYKFLKEKEKESSKFCQNEIELIGISNQNELWDLDDSINKLKFLLNSLQKSYKKINENNLNGIRIDPVEYGIYLLIWLELYSINEVKKHGKIEFADDIDGEEINENEVKIDVDEIDGEPLDDEIKRIDVDEIDGEPIDEDF